MLVVTKTSHDDNKKRRTRGSPFIPTFQPSNLLRQFHNISLQPPMLAGQDLLGQLVRRHILVAPQPVELRPHPPPRLPAEYVGQMHGARAGGTVTLEQALRP